MARHSAVLHTLAVSGEDTEPKAAATDDTEDAISITSTPYASDDSQREYLVEDILAQDDSDGDVKYLVQWTGYPLEECTWELGENMDSGLLRDLWDDKIAKKSYRPFDITLFYDAIARKQSRHFRRNLMRKARGLPQTFPFENESESSAVCETAPEATVALEGKAAKASRDTALSTTELVGANAPSIDLTDIIQESDEDVVALDKISTPATAKPKKEKKKKQKAAQPKGKKKEDPKPASEKKPDAVASGPADNAPTISTASSVLSGQAEQLGKKPPSGSAKKLKSVEPPLAPQASAVASRSLSRQNAHPPLRGGSQVAAKMPSVKASTAAKKAGSSKTDTEAGGVKTFSARKSSKSTQQTGNAFNSGKKIRVRPNLVTAMSDPSKPQHLFTSRRQLRIAEQQERDKPDAAIEASRLTAHLFPISAGPPAALSIMAKTSNQQKGLLKNLGAPDTSTQALQALRKKSVHFSDVGDDNESVVTRIRLISPPYEGPASSEDDDMAMHLETIVTGLQLPDRAVKLFIGTQEVPLSVISSATAYEDGTQGVLDEVFENNSLHLRYACLAETLLHQLEGIRNRILFSGRFAADPSSKSDGQRLDNVSQRLRSMTSGLIFFNTTFALLMYPAQCEAWSEERFHFPLARSRDASSPLRYVVFSTYFDASSLLRPQKCDADNFKIPIGEGERVHLMRKLLNLDRASFERLFPPHAENGQRTAILGFPPSSSAFAQQLALWIRDIDLNCAVLFSSTPGAWMAFCDKILTRSGNGTVIVHEQVISAIRRFPGFNNLLVAENGTCRFWSISQSILSPPLLPSWEPYEDQVLSGNGLADIGQISWTQLFPSGLAVFITPSFMVSEPLRTRALLQWVLKARQAGNILITLVTAWNFCGYLHELAEEKLRHYEELQADNAAPKAQRRAESDRLGIGIRMCYVRFETHLLALELCDMQGAAYSSPVEYADRSIDANDEQSLVNWFGWWASSRFDCSRLFHVVGSDFEVNSTHPSLTSRLVRIPSFTPDSTGNPDVAWERMQGTLDQRSRTNDTDQYTRQAISAFKPSAPKSRYFPDASSRDFTSHLLAYETLNTTCQLYRYAVYWRNADEAMKQSQSRSFNFSIEKWFEFSSAARNKGRPYVGFFNMPIDSSGTDSEKQEGKPTRQPFVAIYRPMNSKSNKTIKTAELIFWDCRAKSKFQGQSVLYRNDLTSAQLAVVDYVLEYGFERHRMNLGRVFIGGEPFQSRNPGDLPKVLFKRPVSGLGSPPDQVPFNNNDIDATMEFIDEMASDFIECFPVLDELLESRGYLHVQLIKNRPPGQLGQQGQQHPARQAGLEETKKQIDSTGKQQGGDSKNAKTGFNENTRIVFHAPRGDRMRHGKASNCSNRFFEAARVAKMRTPQQNMMSFDFLPTMEWYGHQVVEDRGYEHLHVNSWKSFFNTYGIEQ